MVTETERYLFDLKGYFVVRNALTAKQIKEINNIIDEKTDSKTDVVAGEYIGLAMERHRILRELIDNPSILPYLENWLGFKKFESEHIRSGVRLDHAYFVISDNADPGLDLHLGGTPYVPTASYHVRDGKIFSALTVVSYVLNEIEPGKGGFACIPGSHKSNFECPRQFISKADKSIIESPSVRPGDAIIFTEALTHGSFEWGGAYQRRALLYKYSPNHMAWVKPSWSEDILNLCTSRQRELLESPYLQSAP